MGWVADTLLGRWQHSCDKCHGALCNDWAAREPHMRGIHRQTGTDMTYSFRFAIAGAVLAGAVLVIPAVVEAQDTKPVVMSHELEGREQCAMCHSGAIPDVPAAPKSHEGREVGTCLWCHGADAAMQSKTPTAIPHELEGREACAMCHSGAIPDVPASPADHKDRKDGQCQMCHKGT